MKEQRIVLDKEEETKDYGKTTGFTVSFPLFYV